MGAVRGFRSFPRSLWLIVVALAVCGLVFGPEGGSSAAEIDTSLLPVCRALESGDKSSAVVARLNSHPVMAKLKQGFGTSFNPSPDIAGNGARTLAALDLVEESAGRLVADAIAAQNLLPENAVPAAVKVHFVCGSPSDGYGFAIDGEKQLFIDVGNVTADFMPHLLVHEFWHVGYKQVFDDHFRSEFHAADPLRRLAYQLVNEGVGHYYSFRRRLVPENTYPDWPDRTAAIFALLHDKAQQLAGVEGREDQDILIYRSHAGVPFWKKWGAVPGAVITYRLVSMAGEKKTASLIASGPCAFLSYYQQAAETRDHWEQLPDSLLFATCG